MELEELGGMESHLNLKKQQGLSVQKLLVKNGISDFDAANQVSTGHHCFGEAL